jgi:hypothetical protein
MKEFDFKEFYKNLQKNLTQASRFVDDIENLNWRRKQNSGEELDFTKDRLAETLELVKMKIDFAYEYLSLDKMSDKLNVELEKYKGNFGRLSFLPFAEVLYSPVQWILTRHLSALTSHVKLETESEFENTNSILLLEQILRGTAKMLTDRNIEPSNEAEVRNEVYNTLIHVFPDTVREIPISKISKVYKPDIGIKRLKSAVEYKFVDSGTEAKTAIGGIFEDINGYAGSADWTTFYAVIYMTDNFLTQDQIVAEFQLSDVPHHWKPIIVFGKGARLKRTRTKTKNGA